MTAKYQRPAGSYSGQNGLENRTKYQDDASAIPRRPISSGKIDGDLNYLVDAVNETWGTLTAASFATALPDQAGNANKVPVTDGTTTAWQLLGNANVAERSLGLSKMANPGANTLAGAGDDGLMTALTVGNGLAVAGGTLGVTLAGVPSGALTPFAGAAAPAGWLFCYGQAVSRATYATLFGVIGTVYGAGDGTTTFNLPDLRGRGVFGVDNMGGSAASRVTSGVCGIAGSTLGATGGDQRLHQHTHGVTDPGHTHGFKSSYTINPGGGGRDISSGGTTQTAGINSATTGITLQDAGAGSSQNMPPVMMLNWIIRT